MQVGSALALFSAVAALCTNTARAQPVQLCACDDNSPSQTWSWGTPGRATDGNGMATAMSTIQLKREPHMCLYAGRVPNKPSYLSVDFCNSTAAGNPVQLSLRAQSNKLSERDLAVFTDGAASRPKCMDADGMSRNLQLFDCEEGDDDQQ